MRDNYGNRRQSITKILLIGGIILFICLGVCIFEISILESSYKAEISSDFQKHHECTAVTMESMVENIAELVEVAAFQCADESKELTRQRIYNLLKEYDTYEGFLHFVYLSKDGNAHISTGYRHMSELPENQVKVLSTVLEQDSEYICFAENYSLNQSYELVISCPVVRSGDVVGYCIANVDMDNFLSSPAYQYQNDIGECYITNSKGDIFVRSMDAHMIPMSEPNFLTGILAYSNQKSSTARILEELWGQVQRQSIGYSSIKNYNNENIQISYCPFTNIEDAYFISCYNDNLVSDRIHPLIYRAVLSCMVIIVLMVAIILYVWATAKNANITIEKLAYEDPVTRGKNLNYFNEFAPRMMHIYRETPFVIHRFDIANFRYINEAYGHKKADEILRSCIKNFDAIFGDNELCVRMDADQFLALIVNDSSANQRLVQYRKNVNEDARSIGVKYPIRFKTGIYQGKKHESDIAVWIDHANVARRSLKGDETEMTAVYSDRIVTQMQKGNRIELDMQNALAKGEFKVFLQPKWDIYVNQISGAEALVRWIKPDGTMIYPDEFIPIFEKNGFIEKLDFYMLEMVCQGVHQMMEEGRTIYPISINQSRLLLHSPDYVTNVEKIIRTYQIPENVIELEITESVFQNDRNLMLYTMSKLKECGVRVAMDDFGSGYSSLNMLKDVPFDIIKIDREFFGESIASEKTRWILKKMIEMANGLGIEVICEGVETQEQVDFLREIGCRSVQGYFYERPIPEKQFEEKYCRVNLYSQWNI